MKLTDQVVVRKEAASPAKVIQLYKAFTTGYKLWIACALWKEAMKIINLYRQLPYWLALTLISSILTSGKLKKLPKQWFFLFLKRLEKPYARRLAGIRNGIKAALCTWKVLLFISNKVCDEEIDRLKDCTIAVTSSLRKEQPIFFLKIGQSLLLLEEQIISKPIYYCQKFISNIGE